MIVRQFLQWFRTASAGERAEATSALARAYLYSNLSPDDLAAAEGAMTMLLDDPSPIVRRTLAETLASSQKAPPSVIFSLSQDQADIARIILQRSPLLLDSDLIEALGHGGPTAHAAIAQRALLPASVAAAIAEIGTGESCLLLLENPDAKIAVFSVDRIVERFGHLAAIREVLLDRDDLPAPTRQALVAKLSATLAGFVASRDWLAVDRAHRITREACEKATVALAADTPEPEVRGLVGHLRATGQLTAGLVLRALLSGNVTCFEEALADLSGMSLDRVAGLVHGKASAGFRALYDKAGLPASSYPAFREAIAAMHEESFGGEPGGAAHLERRMIERVLTRCDDAEIGELDQLFSLLRRFAAEAARDEARMFCDELIENAAPSPASRLIAA